MLNIEQNKVIKIFTIMNVIFLPPTLIASIYGMNFDNMPELHWRFGYLYVLAVMAAVVVVMVTYFRRKRWL